MNIRMTTKTGEKKEKSRKTRTRRRKNQSWSAVSVLFQCPVPANRGVMRG